MISMTNSGSCVKATTGTVFEGDYEDMVLYWSLGCLIMVFRCTTLMLP